jgi:phosphate transport system protein
MDLRAHTSQEFEAELEMLRAKLHAMGRHVDGVVEAAGRALVGRDVALADSVILSDEETDAMELEIDHLCLEILARRQPVASDLRLLTAFLKIVVDLERVGDLGVSIATRVLDLERDPPLLSYEELLQTLRLARAMVSDALRALVTEDVALAQEVIAKEGVVETISARIFDAVVSSARVDEHNVFRATRIQSISRYIDRIADHGVNIAERVVFVLTGEDVRHRPRARRATIS